MTLRGPRMFTNLGVFIMQSVVLWKRNNFGYNAGDVNDLL